MNNETSFEIFLNQHDEEAWSATLATLQRSINEVDRNATQIWFAFYPLPLYRALEQVDDREKLAQQLLLLGDYALKNQIDTSHRFLYGHRFWPQVKKAVEQYADEWHRVQSTEAGVGCRVSGVGTSTLYPTPNTLHPMSSQTRVYATSLADQILEVAHAVAEQSRIDQALLVGITAVAFMTVQQAGLAAFKRAPGAITIDRKHAKKSPEQILRERAKDDSQGFLGFLKTVDKQWTVTWDENDEGARYKLREAQDLAWGAANDQSRDWKAVDSRRVEGPIPVECRSASCGTCWVGVLGGVEKLTDVGAREGKKIKEFGYIDTAEPKPLIRLACQAQSQGAVSIVIPPWNGQFGKYLKALKEDRQVSVVQHENSSRSQATGNEAIN